MNAAHHETTTYGNEAASLKYVSRWLQVPDGRAWPEMHYQPSDKFFARQTKASQVVRCIVVRSAIRPRCEQAPACCQIQACHNDVVDHAREFVAHAGRVTPQRRRSVGNSMSY